MSSEKPEIQLFIKSSTIDRERKGSCPLCQQWFMAACILTEQDILSFHVTIVDAESPPKDFKDLSQSKIFPVVKGIRGNNRKGQDIGDKLADDHERLEEFFESFDCPDLKRDGSVQKHFDDLYKYFNAFLQAGTPQSKQRLTSHLEKLNTFLEAENEHYITKNTVTYGDCYLMPRLHHIKVAGKEYAEFEIPENLFYVWRYLYQAYNTQAFLETCPTDQDIVKHYEKKAKQFKPKKGVPSLQKETYSYDVPQAVLDAMGSHDYHTEPADDDDNNTYANVDQTDLHYPEPTEPDDHDAGYHEPGNGEMEYENTADFGHRGDNGYGDAETGEPMQAASPRRSPSPPVDATYEDPDTYKTSDQGAVDSDQGAVNTGSPHRSASPVADSPRASPVTGSPQRSASPEPMDGSPKPPQHEDHDLYENVDNQVTEPSENTKSVEFNVADENENNPNSVELEYDQVPPIHVNGTNQVPPIHVNGTNDHGDAGHN